MKENNKVEIIEVWKPVKSGGEMYEPLRKQPYKLVAFLAGGKPLFLEKDWCLQRRFVTKQEAKNLSTPSK